MASGVVTQQVGGGQYVALGRDMNLGLILCPGETKKLGMWGVWPDGHRGKVVLGTAISAGSSGGQGGLTMEGL